MQVVLNDPRGFADLEFRAGLGHDPSPGLEWDRPIVLNGEIGEVVITIAPGLAAVRFWPDAPISYVRWDHLIPVGLQ